MKYSRCFYSAGVRKVHLNKIAPCILLAEEKVCFFHFGTGTSVIMHVVCASYIWYLKTCCFGDICFLFMRASSDSNCWEEFSSLLSAMWKELSAICFVRPTRLTKLRESGIDSFIVIFSQNLFVYKFIKLVWAIFWSNYDAMIKGYKAKPAVKVGKFCRGLEYIKTDA